MSTPQHTVNTLLQWCKDNDVWIDPRLQVRCDNESGIRVCSSESYIPPYTSLVHIHKNSVLSVRNCALSNLITPVISGSEAQLALSLALYVELLRGRSSRWFGYLQSLPNQTVDLPLFWGCESSGDSDRMRSDGITGLEWLKGTEVERYLRKSDQRLEAIDEYYFRIAEPLLLQHLQELDAIPKPKPSLKGYHHSYSLVSSRAFLVDAYHGLSMVPVADAFNHSQENHIHLETDFGVCSQCGSLQECLHDREDPAIEMPSTFSGLPQPRSGAAHTPSTEEIDSYYEMVSNIPITPRSEVFNTYGENLTNAQLLAQYGFLLDVNDNDHLSWDVESIDQICVDGFDNHILELGSIRSAVLGDIMQTGMLERFSESNLVYHQEENPGSGLCLDGDGKISLQLWVLLTVPLVLKDDVENQLDNVMAIVEALKSLLELQLIIEKFTEVEDAVQQECSDHLALPVLVELARTVIWLCLVRKGQLGKGGDNQDDGDLNAIIDGTPEEMHRTRLALTIVMGEESLLNACKSGWEEVLMVIG